MPPDSRGYGWFAGSIASWFGAWGMQAVLFSWLVVGELQASPEWVGVCQTSMMLPTLLFLLVGGATADRLDPRRVLVVLHVVAAVPVVLLAATVAAGWLTIPVLLVYGSCIGTLFAFTMPARDTLLSRVAGEDMMRAVTGMTAAQFGSQAAGTFVAGAARFIGSAPMLLAQAGLLLVGSFAASRIPAPPSTLRPSGVISLGEIVEGLAEVARTPRLRAPVSLVFAVGFLFVGPFIVVFPLLVRDFYHGDVDELSIVLMMFPIGTIVGSLLLRARGRLRRKGRSLLFALTGGACMLAGIGLGLPFPLMTAATLVWGLFGSLFINSSRTLYQEAAPVERRARVLSVYQLGFMGAAPLGALGAGFVSGWVGPLDALKFFAGGMLVVVVLAALFSDIARME